MNTKYKLNIFTNINAVFLKLRKEASLNVLSLTFTFNYLFVIKCKNEPIIKVYSSDI